MKPEENVCHILVLSYSTLHTAEAVAAWNEAVAVGIPFSHAVFTHYLLDGNVDFLVLLDLLDFLCKKFFSLLLLAPSAASWSRARHANSAVRHVRSRAHPLGCPDLSPRDRQYTQDSNNNFIVAAWFVEQAALERVPFLFLCPEDFGGHSQHGPASPWSLVEFQRVSGLNDVWQGAAFMCRFAHTEQRHPTGMLTNIQGQQRSVYLGWPTFNGIDGNLQYSGPQYAPAQGNTRRPSAGRKRRSLHHLRSHSPRSFGSVFYGARGRQAKFPLGLGIKACQPTAQQQSH